MKNKKVSIRTRMLITFGAIIAVLMVCLVIVYSILMTNSISKKIRSQITNLTELSDEFAAEYSIDSEQYAEELFGEIQRRIYSSSELGAIMINEDYGEILQNINFDYKAKKTEVEELISEISAENLADGEVKPFSDKYAKYVLTKISLGESPKYKNRYILVFADLNQYNSIMDSSEFVLRITAMFAFVLMFTGVFIVSQSISAPIKKLRKFANDIGHGDFKTHEYEFSISELDDLAKNMDASARKLDKYDKDQKQFFQNVSHELRTPLMSIQGYAEGIQYGVFPDNKEAAGIIVDESKRLANMLEQVLYISKVDLNGLNFTMCNLCDILRSAKEKLDGLTVDGKKSIDLVLPEGEIMINADSDAMLRAFMNVISNGIRYAKSRVDVRINENKGIINVIISDDGEGISEKDIPHIFDRFYKGKNGKNGIGLSIAKSIADLHHYELTAENTDEGARFVFSIKI